MLFQNPSTKPALLAQAEGQITAFYCEQRSSWIDGNIFRMSECRWWGGSSKYSWNIKGLDSYEHTWTHILEYMLRCLLCWPHFTIALVRALRHSIWKTCKKQKSPSCSSRWIYMAYDFSEAQQPNRNLDFYSGIANAAQFP